MENKNLEHKTEIEKPSLYDFTRKSVVGAFYRVGASFTMDAVYLSLAAAGAYYLSDNSDTDSLESLAKGFSDFVHSLNPWKLLRVTGFVVGINFVDYKFDVTNKLDNLTKKTERGLINLVNKYSKKEKK